MDFLFGIEVHPVISPPVSLRYKPTASFDVKPKLIHKLSTIILSLHIGQVQPGQAALPMAIGGAQERPAARRPRRAPASVLPRVNHARARAEARMVVVSSEARAEPWRRP